MRVLVTGHNGYIGSVMVDVLVRAGPRMAEGAALMARCLNGAAR